MCDTISIMKVIIIDEKRQEFNGKLYTKYNSPAYFVNGNKTLHCAVWVYFHGVVPKGYCIHHSDGNITNNQLENLRLISKSGHMSYHMKKRMTPEYKKKLIDRLIKIRPLSNKWQGSKEGLIFHSKLAKYQWKNRIKKDNNCMVCGRKYKTYWSLVCSNACKLRKWRLNKL